MRCVFLDIDGVLNRLAYIHAAQATRRLTCVDRPELEIDPVTVAHLNRLLATTGARVVVSSSWRQRLTRLELVAALTARGFRGAVIGTTPRLYLDAAGRKLRRGDEIAAWLAAHPYVSSFVILDDETDMAHLATHLVKTRLDVGLTESSTDAAIRTLQSQDVGGSYPPDHATLMLGEDADAVCAVKVVELARDCVRVDHAGAVWSFDRRTGQRCDGPDGEWLLVSHLRPSLRRRCFDRGGRDEASPSVAGGAQ